MTSPYARRADVAQAIAVNLVAPGFRRYLDEHPQTRDADGDPVILAFDQDETMDAVITGASPHDHAVMLSTILDGHIFVCIIGASVRPGMPVPRTATTLHTDASTTVADFARVLLPLTDGDEFVVTYHVAPQDQRVLVGSR